MFLLYKLYQPPKERTLPIYQWGTLWTVFEQSSVFPGGTMVRGQTFQEGRPILGGLQHLGREVASDTPMEADLQFL